MRSQVKKYKIWEKDAILYSEVHLNAKGSASLQLMLNANSELKSELSRILGNGIDVDSAKRKI